MAAPPATETESTAQDSGGGVRMLGIDPVVSSAARRRHPQAAAAAAELLEEESTDLGGAQGVSGGARGGHQDYHRAAWPGNPSTLSSYRLHRVASIQAGSNMASGGEARVSSRRLPNATVTNAT